MAGNKFDQGKLKWHLLPKLLLVPVVKVLMMGAEKYSDWNWIEVVMEDRKRLLDAIDRHILDYTYVRVKDKESRISHLAHVICNCLFLMYYDSDENTKETINGRKDI